MESEEQILYLVGVDSKEKTEKAEIVRNLIAKSKPANVLLELCDERFEQRFNDVMQHPNYKYSINNVHTVIDEDHALLSEISPFPAEDLPWLLAIDTCSFRLGQCKSHLADRDYKLTQKRLKSKIKLLDIVEAETNQIPEASSKALDSSGES